MCITASSRLSPTTSAIGRERERKSQNPAASESAGETDSPSSWLEEACRRGRRIGGLRFLVVSIMGLEGIGALTHDGVAKGSWRLTAFSFHGAAGDGERVKESRGGCR
jgi:hypothetical protein